MAHTGMDKKLPGLPPSCSDFQDTDLSQETFHRIQGQLRQHLQKRVPHSKKARMQMQLLDNMILEQVSFYVAYCVSLYSVCSMG